MPVLAVDLVLPGRRDKPGESDRQAGLQALAEVQAPAGRAVGRRGATGSPMVGGGELMEAHPIGATWCAVPKSPRPVGP
jgi:hypothetical protein